MASSPASFDAALVIGRFQPFHNGHLALVRRALSLAPRVFVVVGSALGARTPRNPWTHQERAAMILQALSPADQSRVTCIPLRDYYDEPRWRAALVHEVSAQLEQEDAGVVVVGHFKDATSEYLRGFAGWRLESLPLQGDIHATPLRERYLSPLETERDTALAELSKLAPEQTVAWLRAFLHSPEYPRLVEELTRLNEYKRAWSAAPFPPVFVTVDAIVTCRDHVLLIQRGKPPGKGLWALPGGFLELDETTHQSALRELEEETGLVLTGEPSKPRGSAVFDHPQRSLRGRTISHAFHFDLSSHTTLPHVKACDDAAECRWVPRNELLALESSLLDDHLLMLDRFLGLLQQH